MPNQVRLLKAGQCASHDRAAVRKSNLAGGDPADFSGQVIVDFVAYGQKPHHLIGCFRSEVNRLKEDLVKVTRAKPPLARADLFQRVLEKRLRQIAAESRSNRMECNHIPRTIREHKQIAACQAPQTARTILNGGHIGGRHERTEVRKIGQ